MSTDCWNSVAGADPGDLPIALNSVAGTDDPGSLSIALLPLTVCWDAGISGLIPFALLALAIWSANVSASDTGRLLVMLIAPTLFAVCALINPHGAVPAEVTGCAQSALG